MKVTIDINTNNDSDNPEEVLKHLTVIRNQIKAAFLPKNASKIKHTTGGHTIYLEDNNCYGTHEVEVAKLIEESNFITV